MFRKVEYITIVFLSMVFATALVAGDGDTTIVSVFNENGIHWGDETMFENDSITAYFGGRIIETAVEIPEFENPVRVSASLEIIPDDGGVPCSADPWDKAGNILLLVDYQSPIELVKFVTGYGGHTFHTEDVSFLSSLLRDEITIQAHIDTWLSPGWLVTLDLIFVEDASYENPAWVTPVYYNQDLKRTDVSGDGPTVDLDVPSGLDEYHLYYFTSGHSTIGSGGDEFVTKDNVIYLNESEVFRDAPWRNDCGSFGGVNPCGNFPPSRAGWCPGDEIHPYFIDITDGMDAGIQSIRHSVEDIREDFGYWRVSSYLAGYGSGEALFPATVDLDALQGLELSLGEVTALRIRLRDAMGNWIYNANGSIMLNSDNTGIFFDDGNDMWANTQVVEVESGELVVFMRGDEPVLDAKVWASDAAGGLQSSDTLYFNIRQTFADSVGYNLSFDGIDDYVDAGNNEALRLTGNQITMEAKILVNEFKSAVWAGSIIVKDQGGSPGTDAGYMLRCGGSGEINMNLGDGTWHELTSATDVIPLQVWTHVAGTYDGQNLRLYVNGNLVSEGDALSINIGDTDAQNLLIGESPQFPGRVWDGQIDEVRLWSVARTQEQLQQTILGKLDSTYYATADSGLVGYWRFDDGDGQIAEDLSVNGSDATLGSTDGKDESDPVWIDSSPKTGINGGESLARRFSLSQNYPNPFNPATQIIFEIPVRRHVELTVYDVLGRQVVKLVDEVRPAGKYSVQWDAQEYASGIYYYRLQSEEVNITKQMMLLK